MKQAFGYFSRCNGIDLINKHLATFKLISTSVWPRFIDKNATVSKPLIPT